MKKTLAFLLFYILIITACKKDIPEKHKDFIGKWENTKMYIEIVENSECLYRYNDPNSESDFEEISGYISFNDESTSITVCQAKRCKTFQIIQSPTKRTNNLNKEETYIILDQEELVKIE